MNINDAIIKGLLSRMVPSGDLIKKELKETKHDLQSAEESLTKSDYKWSIVKSYYAMFHCTRALMFKQGYKDRKHAGIIIFLEELRKNGSITSVEVNDYKAAISAREGADYRYTYSVDIAKNVIQIAKGYINKIRKLV